MSKLSAHWKKVKTAEGLKTPSKRGLEAARLLMAHKNWSTLYPGIKGLNKNMSLNEVAITLETGDFANGIKSFVGSVLEHEGVEI